MPTRSTKRVFLELSIDGKNAGRIVIELFDKIAPKTCENFRALCTGEKAKELCYKGCGFHRVLKGFMIQGGDITAGNGTGGMSIYGKTFDDEEFAENHVEPYLLSMANKGPNTNSSQFFITTAIARHCDAKHVVFGKVVKGHEVVDKIEQLRVDEQAKPYYDVIIVSCGELFKKRRAGSESPEPTENTETVKDNGVSTISASDLPPEPTNQHSFLMRRSKSPPRKVADKAEEKERRKDDKKHGRDRSRNRVRSRSRSRSRNRNRSRDRTRNRSRDQSRDRDRDSRHHRDRRDRDVRRYSRSPRRDRDDRWRGDSKIKTKGRGSICYKRDRSTTPPHWRREQRRTMTLRELAKKREDLGLRPEEPVRRMKKKEEDELPEKKNEEKADEKVDDEEVAERQYTEKPEDAEDDEKADGSSSSSSSGASSAASSPSHDEEVE